MKQVKASQTCAACGTIDSKSRKAKRFECVSCGHVDDADHNAAIEILSRTNKILAEQSAKRTDVQPDTATPCRKGRKNGFKRESLAARAESDCFVKSQRGLTIGVTQWGHNR